MNPTLKLAPMLRVGVAMIMVVGVLTPVFAEPIRNQGAESSSKASTSNKGVQVLEDLVVSRKGNLRGVIYEDDGSLSLSTNSDFEAFLALDSGPGAAINFTVSFAHSSSTMTASGNRTLEMIAAAMAFSGRDVAFEIIIHNAGEAHTDGSSDLVKRRVNQLVSQLKRRHKLDNKITTTLSDHFKVLEVPASRRAPQLLPLTIVNNGSATP